MESQKLFELASSFCKEASRDVNKELKQAKVRTLCQQIKELCDVIPTRYAESQSYPVDAFVAKFYDINFRFTKGSLEEAKRALEYAAEGLERGIF